MKVEAKFSLVDKGSCNSQTQEKGTRNLEVAMQEGSNKITGTVKNLVWAYILRSFSFCY